MEIKTIIGNNIGWVIKTIIPVVISVSGYLIKTELNTLNTHFERIEKRIDESNNQTRTIFKNTLQEHLKVEQEANNVIFNQIAKLNHDKNSDIFELKNLVNTMYQNQMQNTPVQPTVNDTIVPRQYKIAVRKKDD